MAIRSEVQEAKDYMSDHEFNIQRIHEPYLDDAEIEVDHIQSLITFLHRQLAISSLSLEAYEALYPSRKSSMLRALTELSEADELEDEEEMTTLEHNQTLALLIGRLEIYQEEIYLRTHEISLPQALLDYICSENEPWSDAAASAVMYQMETFYKTGLHPDDFFNEVWAFVEPKLAGTNIELEEFEWLRNH